MKLSRALELFNTANLAANRSEYTLKWYRQYLARLVEFTKDAEVESLKTADLNEFVAYLRIKGQKYEHHHWRKPVQGSLSPRTLQGYVQAIKAFFNWLDEDGYLESENPAVRLKKPKMPPPVPKGIEDADLNAMVQTAKVSARDLALVLFLAETGCRIGGLVSLQVHDLDLAHCSAQVIEKGSKSRCVFFSPLTRAAMEKWLTERPTETDSVFIGAKGNPLTIYGIEQVLKRLKRKAGIKGRANAHSFRHAFAIRFSMNGGDLGSLSQILGHSDVSVTKAFYAIFSNKDLQRKHQQHSRLDKILTET